MSIVNYRSTTMSDTGTATWLTYTFTVYPHAGTSWNSVAGIYILTGVNRQNQWEPLYIGQCDSFLSRIPSHERWDEAQALGARHIHALVVSKQEDRDIIEKALIRAYQPPLNDLLKKYLSL